MNGLDLTHEYQWSLGYFFDSTHPMLQLNKETIVNTWVMLIILLFLCLIGRFVLLRKKSVVRYLALSYVQFFDNLCEQALTKFSFTHLTFIGALFTFILFCNLLSLIPYLEEPTTDVNTTLALGLVSFMYTQCAAIAENGIINYIKSYFSPFFFMLPMNLIGKFASIISISFRLFGNIYGGAIIANLWFAFIEKSLLLQMVGIISGLNLLMYLFFNLFEGFLQAFVFTMLSLTYLSLAISGEGH